MIREEDIQKAKDVTFPIPEGGRSYEQSLAASGFELGARWASALNEPNISFKEQMIRSCIEIALTDVSEKRFSDYGTSLKECIDWIEEQQNKIVFYEKQGEQKPFDYEHATITQKDFAPQQEWSKEDENRFQNIIACIEDCYNEKDAQDLIRWFKSLRHQPKPVWSEEDEEMANDLIKGCLSSEKAYHLVHTSKEIADWLDSVKCRIKGKED